MRAYWSPPISFEIQLISETVIIEKFQTAECRDWPIRIKYFREMCNKAKYLINTIKCSDDFSNSVEYCMNCYSLILCSFQVPMEVIDADQIFFNISNTSHGITLTWRVPNNELTCYSTEVQYKSQCVKDWEVLNTHRHLHIWAAVMLTVSIELRLLCLIQYDWKKCSWIWC